MKLAFNRFRYEEPEKENGDYMKAKDLDKIFDEGDVDIRDDLDLSRAFRPGMELSKSVQTSRYLAHSSRA